MKKELLIASLMLASPAAIATSVPSEPSDSLNSGDSIRKATWIFEATDYIRLPRYDYDPITRETSFSHNDVIKASVHFFPVDSKSNLFDFTLEGFDPIKAGEQEFEIAFKTNNLTDDLSYFAGDSTYYGVKKGDDVYLFDCDSTKRCDASDDSQTFAILKMKEDGSLKFVYKSRFFNTPYIVYNYETGEDKDFGAKMKYKLQK